jgi:tetratricopeptide (TPR) repeat protein
LLCGQGKLDEAWRSFDHALRLDPRSGVAHYGKALVHDKRGEFEGVVEELKIALHIDPNLMQAREWLRALERSAQTGI